MSQVRSFLFMIFSIELMIPIRGSCTPLPPVFPTESGPLREGRREFRQIVALFPMLGLIRLAKTKAHHLKAHLDPPVRKLAGYAVALTASGKLMSVGEMPEVWTASGFTLLGNGMGSP